MQKITKESVEKAIQIIHANPQLINGRKSYEYDLITENGENYPPILVLSEAHKILGGEELTLENFGNKITEPFKILRNLGFSVEKKHPTIWIEKTIINNRQDRMEGEYAFGKRLWSPSKGKNGADVYKLMREIKKNDVIIHLTDNKGFTGVSKAVSPFFIGEGVPGTDWEGEAYIVDLTGFIPIKLLKRNSLLNENNKNLLDNIRGRYKVFYNSELNLNQGAYLTECPLELAELINKSYFDEHGEYMPYLPIPENTNMPTPSIEIFKIEDFFTAVEGTNLLFSNKLLTRFCASLITKPFLILTGLSGSGKTKLAQAFSKWISANNRQYILIPVGADWTNREPLLGYPNALEAKTYIIPENGALQLIIDATNNPDKPFFLILDEMNLSHVERYFADFLSAMESEESIFLHAGKEPYNDIPPNLKLPDNIFIIGTVNIDETTYMFSPKVLDRANVIEFRVDESEMKNFMLGHTIVDFNTLEKKGVSMAEDFMKKIRTKYPNSSFSQEIAEDLLNFFNELKQVSAEFGYRTASEIMRFTEVTRQLNSTWTKEEILDAAVMQKLLPKLHGSQRKLNKPLKALAELCFTHEHKSLASDALNPKASIDFTDSQKIKLPISLEKIRRMNINLINNNFTSYAEA